MARRGNCWMEMNSTENFDFVQWLVVGYRIIKDRHMPHGGVVDSRINHDRRGRRKEREDTTKQKM